MTQPHLAFWRKALAFTAFGLFFISFTTASAQPTAVSVTTSSPIETQLRYALPSGWTERYDGDGIRWGSFVGPDGAAVVVTRFPGAVGDDLMNINRWRGQLNLPTMTEGKMETLKDSPMNWRYVFIDNGKSLMGGAIADVDGTSLVFKLNVETTDKQKLEKIKNDFVQILKNTRWE